MTTTLRQHLEECRPSLDTLQAYIHRNPELGFKEHLAHAKLTEYLMETGWDVETALGGLETAFRATHTQGVGGPVIALCSEYDALPEIGHACGHNLIAILGVAAASGVREVIRKSQTPCTIQIVGTPAEEGLGGKVDLMEAGVFDGVDVALMAHPAPFECPYWSSLASSRVTVEYQGKPAHAGASPWDGVNALDAMVAAYNAISTLRQQTKEDTRLSFIITKGGSASNVIPEYSKGEIGLRTGRLRDLEALKERVIRCLEGAALQTGCTLTTRWTRPYGDMQQNSVMMDLYSKHYEGITGRSLPTRERQRELPRGSTDMGNVSQVVPSIHPLYRIPAKAGNHTEGFTAAAATQDAVTATLRCAEAVAQTALDVLQQPAVLSAVRQEFSVLQRPRSKL